MCPDKQTPNPFPFTCFMKKKSSFINCHVSLIHRSIHILINWNYATLEVRKSWLVSLLFSNRYIFLYLISRCHNIILIGLMFRLKESQTFHIYVLDIIGLQNWYLVQQNTLPPLTSGLLDVYWLSYCWDRLVNQFITFVFPQFKWSYMFQILIRKFPWRFQPLFPGENGVDQLVEIIKVVMSRAILVPSSADLLVWSIEICLFAYRFWAAQQGRR